MKSKKKDWLRFWWVFLYAPIYMIIFFLEERYITDCHLIGIPLDHKIPFIEWFFFPYYIWFPFIAAVVVRLFFKDKVTFLKTAGFLYFGMTLFLIVNVVYPNRLDIRPTEFTRDNIAIRLAQAMYEGDTPTNVLPSIHVYNSLGVLLGVWTTKKDMKHKAIKWGVTILSIVISCSTVFVKQHSVIDVAAAFILAVPAYWFFFKGAYARKMDTLSV
ncbi:MAG: phosphatase PAP2 family protein [Lachnospiraceae bacterium]|nr:phosphatase PAP2 family protein [Lachnospiraceae bacterium]